MASMTPRMRIRAALNHQEPDRVPLDMGSGNSTPQVKFYSELKKLMGVVSPTEVFYRTHVETDEDILKRLSIDVRYIRIGSPFGYQPRWVAENKWIDEYGVNWEKPEGSFYWDPRPPYPLAEATLEDLETFPWPDPDDPGRTAGLAEKAKYLYDNTDYALFIDNPFLGPVEYAWMLLRGPEFFKDLIGNKKFAHRLLEIVTDLQIRMIRNLTDAVGPYTELICLGDDMGTQQHPFFSIQTYREMIKPCHERLFAAVREKYPVRVALHSCGNVYHFLPDLIDAGLEILNPVQVSAQDMGTARLKAEFGDQLTFWGGIDNQGVLPFGSPDEVEDEVITRIKDLAPGGGFLLAPSHNIQAGVPPENIVRMYEAALRHGQYPIVAE